jgi:hypothetical protein
VTGGVTTITSNLDPSRFTFISPTPNDFMIQFTPPAAGPATWLYGTINATFTFVSAAPTAATYCRLAATYTTLGSPVLSGIQLSQGTVFVGQYQQYASITATFTLGVLAGATPYIFYPLFVTIPDASGDGTLNPLSLGMSLSLLSP